MGFELANMSAIVAQLLEDGRDRSRGIHECWSSRVSAHLPSYLSRAKKHAIWAITTANNNHGYEQEDTHCKVQSGRRQTTEKESILSV